MADLERAVEAAAIRAWGEYCWERSSPGQRAWALDDMRENVKAFLAALDPPIDPADLPNMVNLDDADLKAFWVTWMGFADPGDFRGIKAALAAAFGKAPNLTESDSGAVVRGTESLVPAPDGSRVLVVEEDTE